MEKREMTSNTDSELVTRYFNSIDHFVNTGVFSAITGQTFKDILTEFELCDEDFDSIYNPESRPDDLDTFLNYAPLIAVVSSSKLPYKEYFAGIPFRGDGDETYYVYTLKSNLKHFIADKVDVTMKLFKMLCLISAHRHGSR
jgi:hypothetical protein